MLIPPPRSPSARRFESGSAFVQGLLIVAVVVLMVLSWHTLQSMHHQQRILQDLRSEVEEVRKSGVRYAPVQRPAAVDAPGTAEPVEAPTVEPTVEPKEASASAVAKVDIPKPSVDGKDAIGRPLEETPGFTMEPPLGVEIPGRTTPRAPEFVPELCGQYNMSYPSEPDKANWYLTKVGVTRIMTMLVHQRLFNIDPNDPQKLWPELAVAWETSDDKMTYRFHLRKGVTFSDGSPFDADDVLFSFNTIRDPSVEAEPKRAKFEDIESLAKLDSHTIEVRMRRKYWKALKQFGYNLYIFPNEYFERKIPQLAAELGIGRYSVVPGEPGFGEVFNEFKRTMPPGTGPYQWEEGKSWQTNAHITVTANPASWIRAFNPDYYRCERIRWVFIRDDVAREQAFLKGDVDIMVADHDTWEDKHSKNPAITSLADHYTYDHVGLLYNYLMFNCRQFPFNDVAVRRAIAHLMDRETLVARLYRGNGQVATCPTKPTYPEYSHDLEPRKFDPELAKTILAEAGWKDTDGDGLLDKDGRVLEFTFVVPSSRTFYKTVSTMLQESCAKIGVRCVLEPKAWALFVTDLFEHKFQMVCLYAQAEDPWLDLYEDFHSSQAVERGGNYSGWNRPQVDRLLEEMRGEFDDVKRAAMFHEFNRHFHEDVPLVLLTHQRVGVMVNKRLNGVRVRKTGIRPLTMWIDPKNCD